MTVATVGFRNRLARLAAVQRDRRGGERRGWIGLTWQQRTSHHEPVHDDVADATLKVKLGAPHGLTTTEKHRLNADALVLIEV